MGEIRASVGKALQIETLRFRSASLRSSDFAVDSRGLGGEIELLPNAEKADQARRNSGLRGPASVVIDSDDELLE